MQTIDKHTFERKLILPKFSIDIIAPAYSRYGELDLFVQSIINQRAYNWRLHVIHDGFDQGFYNTYSRFNQDWYRIRFSNTQKRFNDYGHTLRDVGIRHSKGNYILVTNADNYYIPNFLAYINSTIERYSPDIIIFDMIHSHQDPGSRHQLSHCFFPTNYSFENIDIGAAVVKGSIARKVGFNGRHFAADWQYFNDLQKALGPKPLIVKIPRIFLVHN